MTLLRAGALFVATALAEILGCYLPYLWLRKGKSFLLVFPAALSLAAFAWLSGANTPSSAQAARIYSDGEARTGTS